MNLAEYQKIRKELNADLEKAREEFDTQEAEVCARALNTLEGVKRAQGF